MKKILFSLGVLVASPFIVSAQTTVSNIGGLLNFFVSLINTVIPFLVVLATLYVVYGVFQFITAAGDEEGRKTGREKIIYGVIGLFIMVSVWGLVNLLNGSLAFGSKSVIAPTPLPPTPNI